MPVTQHPLHRSVHAELPHTALASGRVVDGELIWGPLRLAVTLDIAWIAGLLALATGLAAASFVNGR